MLHLVDKGRSFVQKFIPFIFCYKLKSHLERNLFDLFMLVLFLQLTAILCQLLQKKEYINQRKWSTRQYTLYFCILFLSSRLTVWHLNYTQIFDVTHELFKRFLIFRCIRGDTFDFPCEQILVLVCESKIKQRTEENLLTMLQCKRPTAFIQQIWFVNGNKKKDTMEGMSKKKLMSQNYSGTSC